MTTKPMEAKRLIVRNKDSRLYNAKGSISLDGSNNEMDCQYFTPQNGIVRGGAYNNPDANTQVEFDVNLASLDSCIDLQASHLLVGMKFAKNIDTNTGTGAPYTQYSTGPTVYGDSIPWDAITFMIDSIYVKPSDGAESISEYKSGNDFGKVALVKYLTGYDRKVLTSMDDTFFTPITESSLDTSAVMSDESIERSQNWCTDPAKIHERSISLAMLFSCFDKPVLFQNIKKMKIAINYKPWNVLQFGCTGNGGVLPYGSNYTCIAITDVTLAIVSSRLSYRQEEASIANAQAGMAEHLGFLESNAVSMNYQSQNIVMMPTAHLNNVSWFLRATDSAEMNTGIRCINPTQMIPRVTTPSIGVSFGTSISSWSVSYGNLTIPSLSLDISQDRYMVRAYEMYRMMCFMVNSKIASPAISYSQFINCYGLMCMNLYDTPAMKDTSQAMRLILNISLSNQTPGATSMKGRNISIILQGLRCVSIMPDGSILTMRDSQ